MKAYTYIVVMITLALITGSTVNAQVLEPVSDLPEVNDAEVELPVKELSAAQLEKAERLSEASGVSTEEILLMRQRVSVGRSDLPDMELPEGEVPVQDAPQGKGWGVIAKWLGLHPGTLGKGTGDKFYPKDDGLPELPELSAEANEAVKHVRDREAKRLAQEEKKEQRFSERASHNKEKRSNQRENVRKVSNKNNSKGKPEKAAKPERVSNPNKPVKNK